MKSEKGYFANIPSFTNFLSVFDNNYYPLPDDWFVVMTDVKNSTEAIKRGRYKDVNMAGAAGIIAVLNACNRDEIPYVFGGDGATLIIPPEIKETVTKVLLNTRQLCKKQFNLDLRVGVVSIAEIKKRGGEVLVARYQLSEGVFIAMFSGGGLSIAESLIKEEAGYCLEDSTAGHPDLSGLSCRWEPVRSENGKMLSLLIRAKNASLYKTILNQIYAITDTKNSAPVKGSNTLFTWPPSGLLQEAKIQAKGFVLLHLIGLYLFTLLVYVLMKLNKSIKDFYPSQYVKDLVKNTDYQKFDDTLRMVIDCSEKQVLQIQNYLESLRKEGKIFYGSHTSGNALMTCLVFSTRQDGHIHFIDGEGGGYAAAAMEMKLQMKEAI